MHRLALVLPCVLALTSACYDLPDVADGECGNLVVDVDEDCDQFAPDGASCAAPDEDGAGGCFFECSPDSGASCPDGFRCGADGQCRRPSGGFAEPTSWRLPANQFALGDVDGDGMIDLIGNDQQAITVRYGSGEGQFTDELDYAIRRPTGAVAYGQIGESANLSAVVPIEDGLFVLTGDASRTLQPVAYAPFKIGDMNVTFSALSVEEDPFSQMMLLAANPDGDVGGVFLECCDEDEYAGEQCVVDINCTTPLAIHMADPQAPVPAPFVLDVDGDDRQEFIVFEPGGDRLFVYSSIGNPSNGQGLQSTLRPQLVPTVRLLPAGWTITGSGLVADVDGDGDGDLLFPVMNDQFLDDVAVIYNNAGSLGPATSATFLNPGGAAESGGALMPYAAGDFNGDGMADYLMPWGLFLASRVDPDLDPPPPPASSGPPLQITFLMGSFPDLWGKATFGDFNADGRLDFAAASIAYVNETEIIELDGIDLYINTPAGIPNRFHVDSDRPTAQDTERRTMAIGDFDGDLVTDVGFVGRDQLDTVSVVFGSRDGGFSDAVDMGRLDTIEQFIPVNIPLSSSSFDVMNDLFIVSNRKDQDETVHRSASLMLGDGSRRMVSPLVLSSSLVEGGPPSDPQIPMRAFLGDFNQDQTSDMLVVGVDGEESASVWFLPVGAEARDLLSDPDDVTRRIHTFTPGAVDAFKMRCSTWTVVDLDAAGTHPTDELLGLDDGAECDTSVADGSSGGPDGGDPVDYADSIDLAVVTVFPPEGRCSDPYFCYDQGKLIPDNAALSFPVQVSAGDMDGSGTLDPVVLFRGSEAAMPDTPAGMESPDWLTAGAGVGIVWNKAGDGVDLDRAYEPISTQDRPVQLAPIWLDGDSSRDLVILTNGGVEAARFDPEAGGFDDVATPLFPGVTGHQFAVGDINGDGLDDVAVLHGELVDIYMAMPAPPLGAGELAADKMDVAPSEGGQ